MAFSCLPRSLVTLSRPAISWRHCCSCLSPEVTQNHNMMIFIIWLHLFSSVAQSDSSGSQYIVLSGTDTLYFTKALLRSGDITTTIQHTPAQQETFVVKLKERTCSDNHLSLWRKTECAQLQYSRPNCDGCLHQTVW